MAVEAELDLPADAGKPGFALDAVMQRVAVAIVEIGDAATVTSVDRIAAKRADRTLFDLADRGNPNAVAPGVTFRPVEIAQDTADHRRRFAAWKHHPCRGRAARPANQQGSQGKNKPSDAQCGMECVVSDHNRASA